MALTELDNNPSREVSEVNLIWGGCAEDILASIIKHMKREVLIINKLQTIVDSQDTSFATNLKKLQAFLFS